MANGSHSEGDSTIAYGCYSHVEGANCVTGYQDSKPTANNLTEPSNTNDSVGGYAHAEGAAALAIGKASHAEGCRTFAGGDFSHAEGAGTIAIGDYSHAEGGYTHAEGHYSHAEGMGNYAKNYAQHVCGRCGVIDTTGKAIMQVGVGLSTTNRQDGFVVYTDGTFKFGADNGDYVIISVEDLKALMVSKPTIIKWSADGEINTSYLTEAAIYEYSTIGGKDAILFDAKLRSIWRSAFENSTISTVEVPNEIFTIGISAFKNSAISNITLSQNLRTIDGQAFYGCTVLNNIILPSTLRTIGEQAFENCITLSNVTMGDNCSSVGRQAFCKCTSLQNITFGSGTTLILGGCINGCTALKTITCKAITPPELYGGNYLTNVEAVYVPAESVEAYKSASQWSSYASVITPIE